MKEDTAADDRDKAFPVPPEERICVNTFRSVLSNSQGTGPGRILCRYKCPTFSTDVQRTFEGQPDEGLMLRFINADGVEDVAQYFCPDHVLETDLYLMETKRVPVW